jgi:hypothetical protein
VTDDALAEDLPHRLRFRLAERLATGEVEHVQGRVRAGPLRGRPVRPRRRPRD